MMDAMRKIAELEREVADLRRMLAGVPSRVARPSKLFTWPRLRNYMTSGGSLEINAPAGVAMILAVGGGGGGGGGSQMFGGGGGGGGMATLATVPVTSGAITATVVIGGGGAGALGSLESPTGIPGADGGATTVFGPGGSWYITAKGGSGGGATHIDGGSGGRYITGDASLWGGSGILREGLVQIFQGQNGQAGLALNEGISTSGLGGYGGTAIMPAWIGAFESHDLVGITTAIRAGEGGRGGTAVSAGVVGSPGCVLVYY